MHKARRIGELGIEQLVMVHAAHVMIHSAQMALPESISTDNLGQLFGIHEH